MSTIRLTQVCKASVLALTLTFSSLSIAAPDAPNASTTLSIASAINQSGRQRMLSQRIVKAYCQIHLNVKPAASKQLLQESIDQFESQLVALRGVTSTPALQQAWEEESQLWMKTRMSALSTNDHDNAKKLNEMSDALMEVANKMTRLLETQSGKKSGYWVNVAGRQRMLSQRIAKLYMLKAVGVASPEMNAALDKASAEFLSAHEGLVNGAANNPDIVAELRGAKSQWNYLSIALSGDNAERMESMESVATTSDHIQAIMDRVTKMFERAYGD